ncbi:MAG: glycosyltransferase [Bacteroidetes bacterium]|nr:glycosyltransferase [Fibrella sp.]
MTISLVGSTAFDSLEYHLSDSLRALGHDARTLDVADVMPLPLKVNYWTARFAGPYDRFLAGQLARKIIGQQPDLVLIVYRHLHPVLVDQIKEQLPGTPVVQINPDALTNLEKGQIIAADFDHYFSKEPYIVDCLRHKAGLNAHYLPEGFNPRVHQRPAIEKAVAERETDIDVLLYGSLYAYRARMVEQLVRAGVTVAVYGTEGPYLRSGVRSVFRKQYLIGAEKNRLLYGARIVLNNFHYAEITSVNQKYFEINGIGGFQLCDDKPTVAEYTDVPADRVTYRTTAEAIDKIRYYLTRPDERHEVANRQYVHFQEHHTLDQRMTQLLTTVGLGKPVTTQPVSAR